MWSKNFVLLVISWIELWRFEISCEDSWNFKENNNDIYMDNSCRTVITELSSTIQNPLYPAKEKSSIICQHVIIPKNDTCALRIEFIDVVSIPRADGCSADIFQILNSLDSPSIPQCGFLDGFQFTVRFGENQPITFLVTSQSEARWKVYFKQIPCSAVEDVEALLPKDCGIPGDPAPTTRFQSENIKFIRPTEFLSTDSSPFLPIRETLRNAVTKFSDDLRIVNGNETGVNEFPWQVLLLANGKPLCGGSLITNTHVITAGHCVSIGTTVPLASLLIVDLGDHDLTTAKDSANEVYLVVRIIPHIKHDGVDGDIAMLQLNRPVQFTKAIRPICIPIADDSNHDAEMAVTSGWGKTGDDSVISPVLRKAEIQIVPLDVCRDLWDLVASHAGEVIKDSMICGGGGNVGPCNGDSGGPLMKLNENAYSLIGITSFGSLRGCAIQGIPTVFTRVSSYRHWILLNLIPI